ncbi:AAA family ATPase [Solibacillus sp. FSL H8-0523]|uniref:AAA family ATPase n=1 Tax=Solibacillus sp. FSL H8-0523 TaxID=2954511 RepID=UPI003100C4D2
MKKIEAILIRLRNFKGVEQLLVELNGGNARIYGDNATGKTTVFDAFLWLLFDKDSNNDSKFALQTLTGAGHKVHNLEHTVEAKLLVDGTQMELKKVYHEVYKKPRGSANKVFDGYTTDYFIDGVPLNKKEYVKKIEGIVQEDVFKLLTSPTYFNENVKWQDRRNILLAVCGDISDEDVIASEASLAKLNDVLSGKSIEDMKKIIASRKKHINDELEKIPVRIDEIHKMIPEVQVDAASLKAQVEKLETEINELKDQRYAVTNGGALLDKQHQLKELEMQLSDFKRTFEADSKQEIYKLQTRIQELQGNVQIIKSDIRMNDIEKNDAERDIKSFTDCISNNEQFMQRLREEFAVLKAQEFEYSDECECPTCKQALPAEQVESVRAEALAQFNERISKRQGEIKAEGPVYSEQNKGYQAEIQTINDKLTSAIIPKSEELQGKLASAEKELGKFNERLKQAQTTVPDVTTSENYQEILSEINLTQAVIAEMKANASEVVADIDANIRQFEQDKQGINAELDQLANAQNQRIRIAELEAQQQRLAAEYEALEGNLFLIESFTRKKVEMLTERINSKFKYARFKLFEEQVNGGLNEVCETLYEGVPYGSGLNNAAKINVGLDIINTLSAHYGTLAPIFVDNAEAVTKFIDVESQLISLVVSEHDKQLRIETDPVELKEAI